MRVMYVDDEREHLDRFRETVKKLEGIQEVYLFTDGGKPWILSEITESMRRFWIFICRK